MAVSVSFLKSHGSFPKPSLAASNKNLSSSESYSKAIFQLDRREVSQKVHDEFSMLTLDLPLALFMVLEGFSNHVVLQLCSPK